ncbi:MAG: PTS sugar transporter subunit IIA [Spirochaetaceae bacterium]|jgi:PTS system fructose-specific IIC component/PTS system nitrogen regulatory IIA component|nr:PTS sugar transporter subunit IIA [Spirochaetaceae bacterium]
MFLYEVFPPELIKVGLEAEDKDEAFEEMVDHFCHTVKIKAREEILESLRLRESKMSTGIQKGIAIPHGKTNAVDTVYGILGISKKGIDYDALDGEPVYLLFMMLAPQKDTEQHLRLLKRLAELLDNPQFYTDLITQGDSQGAHGIIKKYEDVLITLD